jgi:hypothetical protein
VSTGTHSTEPNTAWSRWVMAEARQLKAGRWRIYLGPGLNLVRDPSTGSIVTFDSLAAARQWWARLHPGDAPLREAKRCAQCGGYFGEGAGGMLYAGRYYHSAHRPENLDQRLRA